MTGQFRSRSRRVVFSFCLVLAGLALVFPSLLPLRAESTVEVTLPNGQIVTLKKHVKSGFIWYEDEKNYSLLRVKENYEYAKIDPETGHLIPSGLAYGIVDPIQSGVVPGLRYSSRNIRQVRGDNEPSGPKPQDPVGEFNVLVIPIRFSDHKDRKLPDRSVYDRIFNKNGGDPEYAEYGSVRDYLRQVSYNQMATSAYVLPWIELPKDEAYYASATDSETVSGGYRIDEAVHYALDVVDRDPEFATLDLKKLFDRNHDGYLDAVAFIHSGYGAEAGGSRADSRIRSMQYRVSDWTSRTGIKSRHVAVVSGLHGTQGNQPCRVSLLCHEGAHFVGLPDLYDEGPNARANGAGLGFWSLMGFHFGVDKSGKLPMHLSAWEKVQLGWVEPTVISEAGEFSIRAVERYPEIYKIEHGFPPGEYLLIENRQPIGFDRQIPAGKDGQKGGLAIWHIDDRKHRNVDEGYPGVPGYPQNNAHYRVALLQADGEFHLEKPLGNIGDGDDLFRGTNKNRLGPDTTPNTRAYQLGIERDTGISFCEISESAETMTFRVEFLAPQEFKPPKSVEPEANQRQALREKSTGVMTAEITKSQTASKTSMETGIGQQQSLAIKARQTDPFAFTGCCTVLDYPLELKDAVKLQLSGLAVVKPQDDGQIIEIGISTSDTNDDGLNLLPSSHRIATGSNNSTLNLSTKTVISLPPGRSVLKLKVISKGQLELLPGATLKVTQYSP